jgi:hypothetical protein
MQLHAAPLEAAFFKYVARGRVGNTRARFHHFDVEFLEGEIDRGPRGLGGKALPPIFHAEPVAELRSLRLMPIDADHSDRRVIAFDQKYGFALLICDTAHEIDGVVLQVGMRQAPGVLCNTAIIGEMRDCFYVRERRSAQQQPFGLEDAATRLA